MDQWKSGVFPRATNLFPAPYYSVFGADVVIATSGESGFLAAGVVGPNCDCPDIVYTSLDGVNWAPERGLDYNGVTAMTDGAAGLWASNARGIAARVKIPGGPGSSELPAFEYFYYDIAYGNGRYVAVGEAWQDSVSTKRTNIVYSSNGSSWAYALWATVSTVPKPRTVAVAFGNGYFLGVGRTNYPNSQPRVGTSELRVSTMTSPSLIAPWTALTYFAPDAPSSPQAFPPFNDVAFGNGVFVLGSTNVMVITNQTFAGNTSVRTVPVDIPTTNSIQKIFFLNNRFIAAAGPEILSSPDGFTWKNHGALVTDTGPKFITSVAYANGRYVAISGTNFFTSLFTQVSLDAGPGALRISGSTGLVHQVEATATLTTNNWQILTNLTLTNSPQLWTDPQATNFTQRFYRTVLSP